MTADARQYRYLVVDGHSVIYQWPELRELHQRHPRQAREHLRQQLERLHDGGCWLVTLVFDGRQGGEAVKIPGKMALIYSKEGQTADSIIERLTASAPNPRKVVVVSADHAECLTVESLGAFTQSPQWLRREIEDSEEELRQTLRKIEKLSRLR